MKAETIHNLPPILTGEIRHSSGYLIQDFTTNYDTNKDVVENQFSEEEKASRGQAILDRGFISIGYLPISSNKCPQLSKQAG